MNKPETEKRWPKEWYVVMCNGYHVYASKDANDSNSLRNRLAGSLNKTLNQVDVIVMNKNPTVWQN